MKKQDLSKIAKELPDLGISTNQPVRGRSMNPTKAGRIFGRFFPSKTKTVIVKKVIYRGELRDGVNLLNRAERRKRRNK